MMDANQVWDVDEAIANMAQLVEVDPYWIEEPTHADDVLGHASIAAAVTELSDGRCRVATGEVGRQPGHLQAAPAGRRHRRVPGRRLPRRRGQRGAVGTPDGGQVRRAGLPARRRGRAVRVRTASVDLRLPAGRDLPGRPDGRVRRPPARALRRPGPHRRRPLPAADRARILGDDEGGVDRASSRSRTGRRGDDHGSAEPRHAGSPAGRLPAGDTSRAGPARHRASGTGRVPPGASGRLHRGRDRRGRRRLGHHRRRAAQPPGDRRPVRAGRPLQRC